MTGAGENFAGEAGPAADVEDEAWGGEVQEGKGAVGHLRLDGGDAGGGGILLGNGAVVVEVCRAEEGLVCQGQVHEGRRKRGRTGFLLGGTF